MKNIWVSRRLSLPIQKDNQLCTIVILCGRDCRTVRLVVVSFNLENGLHMCSNLNVLLIEGRQQVFRIIYQGSDVMKLEKF
jgi:hypothetical protein